MSMRKFVLEAENYPIKPASMIQTQVNEYSITKPQKVRPKSQHLFRQATKQENQLLLSHVNQIDSSAININLNQSQISNKYDNNELFQKSYQYTLDGISLKPTKIRPKPNNLKVFRSQKKIQQLDIYTLDPKPNTNIISDPIHQLLSVKSLCQYGNSQIKEAISDIQLQPHYKFVVKPNIQDQLRNFQRRIDCLAPTQKADAKYFSLVSEWELINKKQLKIKM
ncbi:hypothetical protein SS50377_24416 [Spironucleus salmonicida]|uniref:Uncharacterized protein n=1 Tax=Spironucleus salmonicida TaxID=348837 RepID=V6LYX7_9EUKA|nr:hypothetical protein SS50377_24416 [Spironucleus salmonicida]|eukprot:EST46034.1 Hypothetical protein SS50377_14022 [Spironucleus salmonicida]